MYTSRRVFTTERYLEMMISTKGRYALRVMIDLAQNDGESFCITERCGRKTGDFHEIFGNDCIVIT